MALDLMRVALFGGTFDPPHLGHLTVMRAAAEAFSLETILVAPTGRQPLKPGGSVEAFADRWAMVGALCAEENLRAGNARLQPSLLDAPREDGRPNFTIDALRQMRTELQGSAAEIFVVIGADAFLGLRKWQEPEALLREARWIVVSRPGFSLDDLGPVELTAERRLRVELLLTVHEDVSATDVRRRLREDDDCCDVVSPGVLRYIREHRLYG